MKSTEASRLVALLQALYRILLGAFPSEFHTEFGEEMAEVFGERLAEAEKQGFWMLLALGGQELRQIPATLLRLRLYLWQKKWQRLRQLFSRVPGQAVFSVPPTDDDGRFSGPQLFLEITPFLFTALLILLLTYQPPWLPFRWPDPLDVAAVWAGVLPLLGLILGLALGMPRWAYPCAGLLVGYTSWALGKQQLIWLWGMLLVAGVFLAVMAVMVHYREQPLPPFFQRLGASAALDWTRLSFGVFGAAPMLVLAAFDDALLNERTPYLALALLLMVLAALVYGRCRRQDRQLAALLVGTTLLLIPALLDHIYWRGGWSGASWLAVLWAGMITLLVSPLLTVPVNWASLNSSPKVEGKE